jgi:MerR family transcriptional regulator, thiopeptide resistance regulator
MSKQKDSNYTVKQVAKISGVSERALRFYDEIGLLKPAFYGENGYRYYQREQLLILQQILFYRELKLDLTAIQKIISDPKFNIQEALRSHRALLANELSKTKVLIETIDNTIALIEKEAPMKENEMYLGFDKEKQAAYEDELIKKYGESARAHIDESKQRTQNWTKRDFEKVQQEYDKIHKELIALIQKGISANAPETQKIIERHYQVVKRFWTPNRESYRQLGQNYCDHPDFKKLYDSYDPRLARYLADAMSEYAEKLV